MKTNYFWLFGWLLSVSVSATPADHTLPVDISADFWEASIKDSISIYREKVEIRQGTMLIKADKLEANASAGKGREMLIASGNPATYYQLLEDGRPVTAKANEIHYDLASRTLTLSGNAELTQSGSLVQSAFIRYNIERQELQAQSDENTRRVTTVFTPETKDNP